MSIWTLRGGGDAVLLAELDAFGWKGDQESVRFLATTGHSARRRLNSNEPLRQLQEGWHPPGPLLSVLVSHGDLAGRQVSCDDQPTETFVVGALSGHLADTEYVDTALCWSAGLFASGVSTKSIAVGCVALQGFLVGRDQDELSLAHG